MRWAWGTNNGFIPLADADPFGPYHLKYARAVAEPVQRDQRKPLTKLGFSIFDETCASRTVGPPRRPGRYPLSQEIRKCP